MQPINPVYPIAAIGSVDELMEIAVAVEAEAARRYEQMARRMDRAGEAELAELFTELAALERAHERGLASWARREGRKEPHPHAFAWLLPETYDLDDEEAAVDPFRALAIAVRNEERAFAFYTYLAATCAEDHALRARAEALAREELEHVARLRAWRRRVWHAARPRPALPPVRSPGDLRLLAHGLEAGSVQVDQLAAATLAAHGAKDAAAVIERCVGRERAIAAENAGRLGAASSPPSAVVAAAERAGLLQPGALTPEGALRLACRNAEEVLEAYLAVAERAEDERVLAEAQRLAQAAVARLALIRSQLPEAGEDR